MKSFDKVRKPTHAEETLIAKINREWRRDYALAELTSALQTAVEIELATLPIYLYSYYSIDRLPKGLADTALARFANKAGAVVMSVAVEEMLHMSLSSNILFSLGQMPELYLKSPGPFPSNLPGHARLGPDHKAMSLSLAKFSETQLWQFLEIEWPATADAPPEGQQWQTIGQVYSYIRCIILSEHICDEDFRQGARLQQIQPGNYSPNNIDTVFPKHGYDPHKSVPEPHSAAKAAAYASREDSHAGRFELLTVDSRVTALEAIQTIDAQGEGYGPHKWDDPSHQELSHYYKFLSLQAQLAGYDPKHPALNRLPTPPAPASEPITAAELAQVVFNFPDNPVAAAYPEGKAQLAQIVSGLYQYMLIMTESIFLQPPQQQKKYFNQALHRSMIWILDKVVQGMRDVTLEPTSSSPSALRLAPTFENLNLGPRAQAFANLSQMCAEFDKHYGNQSWYTSDLQYYIQMIPTLPDVSSLWQSQPAAPELHKFKGVPKFPAAPPATLASDEERHACMGLNSCKNQGRTRDNDCAGQGYCSTALAYNFADPSKPEVADHTCHVKNNCAGQGGCGLYGTGEEQNIPGANDCATLGSCATPMNAERFSTDGPNQGKSVWLRARQVFAEKKWPELREKNPALPEQPPEMPHHDLFRYGPTMEWIETYSGEGMTACGASGMSGAHSCG